MPKFKVTISLDAPDVMMAELAAQGVQNVINELDEHQSFLIQLADAETARDYKNKIMTLVNNPVVKKLAGTFGG